MREKREAWLDTAVSGIRFDPDREAVRAELCAHLEDKTADLRRIFPDIPPDEAQKRALAGMGDVEEIKVELARVHRPWLGYLWRASQVMAAAALIVLSFLVLSLATGGISLDSWVQFGDWSLPEEARVLTLEPSQEQVKINGFTITMTEAVLWNRTYPDGGVEPCLTINLRQSSPCFWLGGGGWHQYVSAEDSAGNYYPSYGEYWLNPPQRDVWNVWECGSVENGAAVQGLFHTDHPFTISLADPGIEWMRLDYSHMGRSFSFTVYLKEAGT